MSRIAGLDIFKKIRIETYAIILAGAGSRPEVHIIGMREEKRHSAVLDDPIQLFLPNPEGLFLENDEQAMILSQGIGKLDKPAQG